MIPEDQMSTFTPYLQHTQVFILETANDARCIEHTTNRYIINKRKNIGIARISSQILMLKCHTETAYIICWKKSQINVSQQISK